MINKEKVDVMYNKNSDGVIHFKNIIPENDLNLILNEIKTNSHLFEKKDEKYIENNQDVALIYRGDFSLTSLDSTVFKNVFRQYIEIRSEIEKFSDLPFEKGNVLEAKIIRYPVSDLGVGIHRDLSSNVNMITFFNLFGKVKFYTYKDKDGNRMNEYLLKAGDISLMRGQRLNEIEDIRPLHGVEEVNEERLVLAIREIRTDLEEIVNKGNWRGF